MRPTFERVPRLSCSSYPMMRAWPKLSLLCPLRKQGPGFVILLELAFPSPEIEMMNVSMYLYIHYSIKDLTSSSRCIFEESFEKLHKVKNSPESLHKPK